MLLVKEVSIYYCLSSEPTPLRSPCVLASVFVPHQDLYIFWLLLFLLVIESPADHFSHLQILSSLLCHRGLSLAYLPTLWSFLLSLLPGSLLLWSPLQGQCSLGLSAWVAAFPSCVPRHRQVSNLWLQAPCVHRSLSLYLQAHVRGFST